MQVIQLGPFSFDAILLLCVIALLVAFGWAIYQDKKYLRLDPSTTRLEPWLWFVVLISLLAGRVAFVVAYWSAYRHQPQHIINIRDGGFSWIAALVVLAVALMWLLFRRPSLLQRALQSTGWAALVIGLGLVWLQPWQSANKSWFAQEQLNQLQPYAVEQSKAPDSLPKGATDWAQYRGQPLVVNLWASWCPPCRREMPVLQAAQKAYPEVHFVFVNQGEHAQTVQNFLEEQALSLDNMWLDHAAQLGAAIESSGLPTTVFIDADGMVQKMRLGELSNASLQSGLDEIRK